MPLREQLERWVGAGLIEPAQAARILEHEQRSGEAAAVAAEPRGLQVTATEVVAYLGSIVVLVGIGFLYGTQYQQLGSLGRDLILGLVALAGLGCGFFMELRSDRPAARRARSAGFFLGISAVFFLATQVLVDGRVLTKLHDYGGGYTSDDTSGDIMAGAAAAFLLAAGLLGRTRAALVALAFAALAYTAMGAFESWWHPSDNVWLAESGYLLVGALLLGSAEVLVGRSTRGWTPEILRFFAVNGTIVGALGLSGQDAGLEILAALIALAALGLAVPRRSVGLVISGGLGLFFVVVEIGFRHFAQTLGYPVVLIASGLVLLAIAAGMVRVLPRLRGRAGRAELGGDRVDLGEENG
jgi:Predicted membrane protein (DUF2157)